MATRAQRSTDYYIKDSRGAPWTASTTRCNLPTVEKPGKERRNPRIPSSPSKPHKRKQSARLTHVYPCRKQNKTSITQPQMSTDQTKHTQRRQRKRNSPQHNKPGEPIPTANQHHKNHHTHDTPTQLHPFHKKPAHPSNYQPKTTNEPGTRVPTSETALPHFPLTAT